MAVVSASVGQVIGVGVGAISAVALFAIVKIGVNDYCAMAAATAGKSDSPPEAIP